MYTFLPPVAGQYYSPRSLLICAQPPLLCLHCVLGLHCRQNIYMNIPCRAYGACSGYGA